MGLGLGQGLGLGLGLGLELGLGLGLGLGSNLLVAQVALVLLVHLVRVGQRHEGVPVARLHLCRMLCFAGRLR